MSFHIGIPRDRRQSIHKTLLHGSHSTKHYSSSYRPPGSTSPASPLRHHSVLNHNSFHHSAFPSTTQSPSMGSLQQDGNSVIRGRRGRQARPSQLSPGMHRAVKRFARSVGAPNVVPPAGFRDFRGWLIKLNSRECRPVWDQLIAAIAKDLSCDVEAVQAMKEDVVREIVKCVVIPRPDESAKLVSTNAGRQASRPRSGTTLMVVLEQQISRVENRLPQLVSEIYPPSGISSSDRRETSGMSSPELVSSNLFGHTSPTGWSHRARSSMAHAHKNGNRLPSIQDLLGENRVHPRPSLPSFKELDASLRRSRSSASGGR